MNIQQVAVILKHVNQYTGILIGDLPVGKNAAKCRNDADSLRLERINEKPLEE